MRRILFPLIIVMMAVSLISLASADIIIIQQPKKLYNLDEVIILPLKITTSAVIDNFLSLKLICDGKQTEIHKQYISLSAGEEKELSPSIPLTENLIGRPVGTCRIKSTLGEDYVLTNEFDVSNLIEIEMKTEKKEFAPEEEIIIEGRAKKESGNLAEGFIKLSITHENLPESIEILDTVNLGYFFINFSLPKETKAGPYTVRLDVYEKEEGAKGNITNKGFLDYNILVTQVPTSLEIAFESPEVEPGANLKAKAILRDQTGEKIDSRAVIKIKDKEGNILKQEEKKTEEFMEFAIPYNEPPAEWKVVAVSGELTSEAAFSIKEKEKIKTELINKTLIITNIGNIPYSKIIVVKIGNETRELNISLDVDETRKYTLKAPDGEYKIEVIENGKSIGTGMAVLTGKKVDVKEASGAVSLMRYPIVWIFITSVLGFVFFMILRKGYKRSFFGYIRTRKKERKKTNSNIKKEPIINSKNMAEFSLSLKGERQDASIVCLKIKNKKEIESNTEGVKETMKKIAEIAEKNKAFVYENQDNFFFILAPVSTRTFKNEKTAVKIAQEIKRVLSEHNRIFKQKVDFGISLNYGEIVAKSDVKSNVLKFMSVGGAIIKSKKIASLSEGEIYLSGKIKDRLISDVKTEKHEINGVEFYTIKDIRDREHHRKFINDFINRLEKLK